MSYKERPRLSGFIIYYSWLFSLMSEKPSGNIVVAEVILPFKLSVFPDIKLFNH